MFIQHPDLILVHQSKLGQQMLNQIKFGIGTITVSYTHLGVVGRLINTRIDNKQVEKLFVVLMFVIIGISCYNTWAFMK